MTSKKTGDPDGLVARWGSTEIPTAVAQRALECWDADENGCWISKYSVASHGYAQIGWRVDGKCYATTAHRAAWVHRNGQIPQGMTVDHRCHTRRCVNPDHLRLLTNEENARGGARDKFGRPLYDENGDLIRPENEAFYIGDAFEAARKKRLEDAWTPPEGEPF